jgi:tetratricopeptide (TPR) repeat protein
MGAHYERAVILYESGRYEMAEQELRQELAADPNHPTAHAFLALCLSKREEFERATDEARTAIHLAPDLGFCHYALACVLQDRNRNEEALPVAREAIRLDPYAAINFALLSSIHYNLRRWQDALDSAEQGLHVDPEDVGCTNLRAMALIKLGRKADAGEAIETALARDPENAFSHANLGWACLERSEPQRAMEHFREALRLDPELEWARAGIVEAMKARNILYRWLLRYFMGMAKLNYKIQWGILIGGYLGINWLDGYARRNPDWKPYVTPLVIVYVVFALLTWLAAPLFNLLLRLDRFGRLALSRDQVVASNWVGSCLLAALSALGAGLATGNDHLLAAAFCFGLLLIPCAAVFHCEPGWPRTTMAAITCVLAIIGLSDVAMFALQVRGAGRLYNLFILGAILSPWVGNWLTMQQVRR